MKVEITRCAWNDETEQKLVEKVPHARWLKPLIKDGFLSLYRVVCEQQLCGAFITRVDTEADNSKELVLVHLASYIDAGKPLHELIHPFLQAIAKVNKCEAIRVHADADKNGLGKMLQMRGFERFEVIYKQKVRYGK